MINVKAIIAEIKEKYAIAIDKNGRFIKVRNNGYMKVGYEYNVSELNSFKIKPLVKMLPLAAAFLLCVGLGYFGYTYNTPSNYVYIDINPSIELSVNAYEKVIDAKGLNDDGNKLLSMSDIDDKDVNDAIETILEDASDEGYIPENTDDISKAVLITIAGNDEEKSEKIGQKIKEKIKERVQAKISEKAGKSEESNEEELDEEESTKSIPEVAIANTQRQQEAKDMGISPGKLMLIERFIESGSDKDVEELKDTSVKDIMSGINEFKQENLPGERKGIDNEKSGKGTNQNNEQEQKGQRGKPETPELPELPEVPVDIDLQGQTRRQGNEETESEEEVEEEEMNLPEEVVPEDIDIVPDIVEENQNGQKAQNGKEVIENIVESSNDDSNATENELPASPIEEQNTENNTEGNQHQGENAPAEETKGKVGSIIEEKKEEINETITEKKVEIENVNESINQAEEETAEQELVEETIEEETEPVPQLEVDIPDIPVEPVQEQNKGENIVEQTGTTQGNQGEIVIKNEEIVEETENDETTTEETENKEGKQEGQDADIPDNNEEQEGTDNAKTIKGQR